jgi:hypothetical protein
MGRRELTAPPSLDGQSPGMPRQTPPYDPSKPCPLCLDLNKNKPGWLGPDWALPDPQDGLGRGLRLLSLDHVELSARQGCRGCRVLADGLALVQPLLLDRGLTPRAPHEIDRYGFIQRQGYSVFYGEPKAAQARRDRIVNRLYDNLGSGLGVTYNFRNGDTDAFGTAADIDFFVANDESAGSMSAIPSFTHPFIESS